MIRKKRIFSKFHGHFKINQLHAKNADTHCDYTSTTRRKSSDSWQSGVRLCKAIFMLCLLLT
jgi:hypothetical protein